jgi:diketogulonate reductase-like aldo/keto reductase
MKTVKLPCGEVVPALGQGAWNIGDNRARRAEEIAALQAGLDLGLTLVDTAEMYGEGNSEALVGEAIRGRRDAVFVVSKVYPHNASKKAMAQACERSLKRLGTDRLDLYLLHWRGNVPLDDTLEGFAALQKAGKIRHFGVSNLDLEDMEELLALPGGADVQVNQLLYNLTRRGLEFDLLPKLREARVPVMAYSPIEQARLLSNRKLVEFAKGCGLSPSQVALAWLLARDDVIAIPKAGNVGHVKENAAALKVQLSAEQLQELDRLFPPPKRRVPLEML